MANTEVITVRVGSGFKQRFTDLCDKAGVTPREVIENFVTDYNEDHLCFKDGHIVGEECPICEDIPPFPDEVFPETDDIPFHEPDGHEYFEFGFDTLVNLLRKKEYPDEYIKKMAESMMGTAYDMPRFNPRRRGGDWGC